RWGGPRCLDPLLCTSSFASNASSLLLVLWLLLQLVQFLLLLLLQFSSCSPFSFLLISFSGFLLCFFPCFPVASLPHYIGGCPDTARLRLRLNGYGTLGSPGTGIVRATVSAA